MGLYVTINFSEFILTLNPFISFTFLNRRGKLAFCVPLFFFAFLLPMAAKQTFKVVLLLEIRFQEK